MPMSPGQEKSHTESHAWRSFDLSFARWSFHSLTATRTASSITSSAKDVTRQRVWQPDSGRCGLRRLPAVSDRRAGQPRRPHSHRLPHQYAEKSMTLTQGLLDRIAGLLNRDATNYTVFLRLYQLSTASGADDLEACIREAMRADAEIGGAEEITAANLIAEMDGLLRYAGDPGAGPAEPVLGSKELSELLTELGGDISQLTSQAKTIKRFWFAAGHPAYPVFWDFAYAFFGNEMATVLVGSSSD